MSGQNNINSAYKILELKPGASPDEVKQAYRQLAKVWHPDRFIDPLQKQEAEEKIKVINQAYEQLKYYQVDAKTSATVDNPTKIYSNSLSADHTVKLWEITTGKVINTLTRHWDRIMSVAFSPDCQLVASSSFDGYVKLFHVRTVQEIYTFRNHFDSVNSIAFSPSNHLVTACSNGTISVLQYQRK